MGDVMPEKRSEIRATSRDSGAITLVGARSGAPPRFPRGGTRSIVIRSANQAGRARCPPQESGNYPERMPGALTNSKTALTHDLRRL